MKRAWTLSAALVLAGCAFAACAASNTDDEHAGNAGGGTSTGGSVGASSSGGSGGSGGKGGELSGLGGALGSGGGEPACAQGTEDVYVASNDGFLYRFDPPTLVFTKIGPIGCPPQPPAGVVTMGVARDGLAWVAVYDSGNPSALAPAFWKIRLSDASCAGTVFMPEGTPPAFLSGEAFVSNTPSSNDETLFLAVDGRDQGISNGPNNTWALVTVNPTTAARTLVGPLSIDGSVSRVDVTGTGDARLFDVTFPNPWQSEGTNTLLLEERDRMTAQVKSSTPIMVNEGFARGFVFWGGSFWFFFEPSVSPGPTPSVGKFDPATNTFSIVVADMGFVPAGAGVSTCAPVVAPK